MTVRTNFPEVFPDEIDSEAIALLEAALPFTIHSPAGEFLGPLVPTRSLEASEFNYVTVEVLTSLRKSQRQSKTLSQDLSMLLSMQLDIVLAVLGHLHPIDLMRMSRTNKALHGLLRSPIAASTWRNAFILAELPLCPPQIPARRWADLLFGPQICDECGGLNTSSDYTIWRRVCRTCLDQKLSYRFPGYDELDKINTLVPRTLREDAGWRFPEGRFWASDGAAVAEQYERCKSQEDPDILQEFIQSRLSLVGEVQSLGSTCDRWAQNLLEDYHNRNYRKLQRVMGSVVKRLAGEGWKVEDIDAVHAEMSRCEQLSHARRLTYKVWNKARPYIIPMVTTARDDRVRYEREILATRRKEVVKTATLAALRTPVPGMRVPRTSLSYAYYPPPHTIYEFTPIMQLIDDPSEENLSSDDPRLAAALADAPAFIDTWCAETQALLASVLPDVDTHALPPTQILARATSVFRCPGRSEATAIGWDEARVHLHGFRGWPFVRSVEFSALGSAVARALALRLGMDPETVTAAEMDAANARFVCGNCSVNVQGRIPGREALRWRECVVHSVEINPRDPESHCEPSFLLLSPLATADVSRREGEDDYTVCPTWSCALCNSHLPGCTSYRNALKHAQVDHGIDRPIEGVHLIYFMFPDRPKRRRAVIAEGANPPTYRCSRCAEDQPSVVKLHSRRAIVRHIVDKHLIDSPGEHDWTDVQRILDPAPGAE
ncbi:hypothetical protein DFH07DRAFT_967673 [Mycena maculata]|uniref:F-box domain-containing protein n=1 Tax=Mycena maculata TaxID=230809 RepID=A0AAD7I3H8_9AGAR|nr:hypothetical protein DFH07DRAFT_967673 [Mycena maculata]